MHLAYEACETYVAYGAYEAHEETYALCEA